MDELLGCGECGGGEDMDWREWGEDGAGGGGDDAFSCSGGGDEVVGDTTQFLHTGLEEEKKKLSI